MTEMAEKSEGSSRSTHIKRRIGLVDIRLRKPMDKNQTPALKQEWLLLLKHVRPSIIIPTRKTKSYKSTYNLTPKWSGWRLFNL